MASSDYYEIVAYKIAALFAIGIISFICGIVPYYFIRSWKNRFPTSTIHKVTSGVICFSGGTLLGITFLHLLPEVREKIEQLQNRPVPYFKVPHSLPLSDIIAMCGFFGVYVLDELMHLIIEWYSLRMLRKDEAKKQTSKYCMQLPQEVSAFSLDKHENSKHQAVTARRSNHHANPITTCVCQSPKLNPGDMLEERELATVTPSQGVICCERRPVLPEKPKETHRHHASLPTMQVSGLITIAALSFHDVFEGMAVGVEPDIRSILFLYLSIASHKYAIAFCIGMDLTIAGSRLKMIVLSMMAFSIVSPIGVVIGMIVVAQKNAEKEVDIDDPVSVVLQGIAGGTLIYVVCFEVLQREGTDTHTKGIQNVLFVIFGFLVTLGFKVLLGHSHPH